MSEQTVLPRQIIIIDSGSCEQEKAALAKYLKGSNFYLSNNNIGFCKGNNIGLSLVKDEINYILFLNPDTFLAKDFIEKAESYMNCYSQRKTAALSCTLMGYDIEKDCPTGKIDSAGIFRKWYGYWYDRCQGDSSDKIEGLKEESVPALCGALMFCRRQALKEVMLSPNEVWDNSFFMYKEDIDLSLRLRQKKWDLKILPNLTAYHCRGWQKNRKEVPKHLRLLSAKNEVKLFTKLHSPCVFYSCFKYLSVKLFNI